MQNIYSFNLCKANRFSENEVCLELLPSIDRSGFISLLSSGDVLSYSLNNPTIQSWRIPPNKQDTNLRFTGVSLFESQVYVSNEKSIKCYDVLRSSSTSAIMEMKSNKTSGETLECVEVGLNGNIVCTGTDAGNDSRILFYDVRNPSKVLAEINDVHNDAITRLKFQHSDNSKLLSGSMGK